MGECDCIGGCEKCATPFNPGNIIRMTWDGVPVVYASDYDRLLKLAQPSADGDGWIAVTPKTMPPLDTWVWVCDVHERVRQDKHSTGNPRQGWWFSFGGSVRYWKPIVLPAAPVAKEGRES